MEDLTSNTDISGKTKMLRKHSKIAVFNILKTSLSLKLSNGHISNNMILMSIQHLYSIYGLYILLIVDVLKLCAFMDNILKSVEN